jgi:hypothetical protein
MAKELLTAHKIRSIATPGVFRDGAGLRLIARRSKSGVQRIEAVFKWAIWCGMREKASPCVGVAQVLGTRHREVRHFAALAWNEVPDFIMQLRRPVRRRWPVTPLAFEFLVVFRLSQWPRCRVRSVLSQTVSVPRLTGSGTE